MTEIEQGQYEALKAAYKLFGQGDLMKFFLFEEHRNINNGFITFRFTRNGSVRNAEKIFSSWKSEWPTVALCRCGKIISAKTQAISISTTASLSWKKIIVHLLQSRLIFNWRRAKFLSRKLEARRLRREFLCCNILSAGLKNSSGRIRRRWSDEIFSTQNQRAIAPPDKSECEFDKHEQSGRKKPGVCGRVAWRPRRGSKKDSRAD